MDHTDSGIRYNWNKGDVIRNRETGHPYMVLHVYKATATLVVDLEEKEPLPIPHTILIREYGKYTADLNMRTKGILNDSIEWEYNPLPETL
jgi:hypothetical protein